MVKKEIVIVDKYADIPQSERRPASEESLQACYKVIRLLADHVRLEHKKAGDPLDRQMLVEKK